MKKKNIPVYELCVLIIGELLVSLLTIGLHLLLDALLDFEFWNFSYRVITGAVLGATVTVFNYLFMTISVNRAVDRFMTLRGTREMNEEEAAKFAAENTMPIQNAIKTSFVVRTFTMLVTLILAFIIDWFAPLATAIPLLAFRPIITVGELLRRRFAKQAAAPVTATFTDITDNDEGDQAILSNEKESDE